MNGRPPGRPIDDEDPTYSVRYDPTARKRHPNEALFLDIPTSMPRLPSGIYAAAGGVIMLPQSAARLAEHVELCGFVLDESKAKIRRVDLPRGAARWQDMREPVPDVDPVDAVHTAAAHALTPAETATLIERLQADIAPLT
ncbi:phage gene 29 protein family protein [Gordonia malaquae]|uniref:phage gene 29 protein family protein n=1 Tax=Gordonia malaquae TaxID=410332 RepID=UPI003016317C